MTVALKEDSPITFIDRTRPRVLPALFISLFFLSLAETDKDHGENGAGVEETIEFSSPSDPHDIIGFNIFDDMARARALLEKKEMRFQDRKAEKGHKDPKGKKIKRQEGPT